MPEIIQTKFISRHHDDLLAKHFDINKTKELTDQKYHWPSLRKDIETYVINCDICLALKAVKYKAYSDLQALPISTYQ